MSMDNFTAVMIASLMGNPRAQEYKRIARTIETQYADGEHTVVADTYGNLAVFQVGPLAIRCRNNPCAVAVLVAKYNRGWRKS